MKQEDREQITYNNLKGQSRFPGDDTLPQVLKDELESVCQSGERLVCYTMELVCNTNKCGFHLERF